MRGLKAILIAVGWLLCCRIQSTLSLISDEGKAEEFLNRVDEQHREWCLDNSRELNYRNLWKFDWQHFSNPELRRAFRLLSTTEPASSYVPNQEDKSKYAELEDAMINGLFGGSVCPYGVDCDETKKLGYSSINSELDTSSDYNKRLYYWKTWRDVTGKTLRNTYSDFVDVANKLVHGYETYGDYWLRDYEMPASDLLQELVKIRDELVPLYQQLHAFVRKRLIDVYGNGKISSNGPIPEHLIGLIPQKWNKILNTINPLENNFDATEKMKEKRMTVQEMVNLAEGFYRSLGIPELNADFWTASAFEKSPEMRECVLEIKEGCAGNGAKIRMCANATEYYFHLLLQLLGDAHQEKAFSTLHTPFQKAANPGFLVAIGRTVDLSAWTDTYLRSVELFDESFDETERDASVLLRIALENIPIIFNALNTEIWRLNLFNKVSSFENMNTDYWEKRVKDEGVCPPVRRTESDFDPAAYIHISTHSQIIDYFVGGVLQFQFHKALSQAAGCSLPLHKCSIYQSAAAGRLLKEVMELGKSKPWPEVLSILTNGQTNKMISGPLLEFFQPLYTWLQHENREEHVGWVADDVTKCP